MESKEDLLNNLQNLYLRLSRLFEKNKKNFCGICHSCCTYIFEHGVCDIEYEYIRRYLQEKDDFQNAGKFRDYIRKKRNLYGELLYTECPLYDKDKKGCSIYTARPYSCRVFGLYGRIPPPPFCTFREYSIIYSSKNFYDIAPLSKEFFEIKSLYEILTADTPEKKAERYYTLAIHFYYRDNLDKAKKFLEMAIETDLTHSQSHYQLALFYYEKDNLEKAILKTEEALIYEPENINMRINLGLFLTKNREYLKAKEVFLYVLDKEPLNKMVLSGLGNIFFLTGDFESASMYCQKALNVDSEFEIAKIILNQFSKGQT
ncbi:MAG TPA: YkgJ family cysteine cluster protein [Candidatus Eremiobacteraeota bacterium]|mgnify:CR=1 FL=1|nr:MAG: Tetratricopeptide repeat protein [bacterium ADurb.Bin363]HPZ06631.1 YkgJ family cysteine cluster protein [Candidatus Eremiobacteraeota bacterium]